MKSPWTNDFIIILKDHDYESERKIKVVKTGDLLNDADIQVCKIHLGHSLVGQRGLESLCKVLHDHLAPLISI